ncbi:reverse transcriptase domain-containing protein [Tanacetum coccineum]
MKAITFKVGQTSRYSYNNAKLVNRIDVIDVSCEEYAQEVLGFSDSSKSGNPTPSLDPILSTSFPSLTPFEGVIKRLDARFIYLIFDSPWVSPVHCVPKKGGMTVVENGKIMELIPLGAENLAADHLSRLENPDQDVLENKEITKTFPTRDTCYTPLKLLSTTYHPQTSVQVEVSNRGLKRILERTIDENHASWSKKLDDGCTPYKLVYRKACHLPIELEHKAYWALKQCNFDLKTAGDHQRVQMKELNELKEQAYENSLIYKEKMKKIHDSKIKNRIFNVGDRVLLFNS